jgi:uncharacterized membrane protein
MAKTTPILQPHPEVQHPGVSSQEHAPETLARREARAINVGEGERYASMTGGLGLMLAGIARRGVGGLILAGLGVAVIQRGLTGHCPLYESMGVTSARAQRPGVPNNRGIKVERGITINRPREEVFSFWRDLRNLSRFMDRIERVDLFGEKRSHWVAKGAGGRRVEWDAEIINEHPNQLIAWESLPGSEVQNAGSVRFEPAPGGRGTEIRVSMEYNPPGGILGALVARLFGEAPDQKMEEDLWRLKQVLEAGEVATTAGQPMGSAKG